MIQWGAKGHQGYCSVRNPCTALCIQLLSENLNVCDSEGWKASELHGLFFSRAVPMILSTVGTRDLGHQAREGRFSQ